MKPSMILASVLALASLTAVASAESNKEAARSMAEALKSTPGIGAVAATVSGKNNNPVPGDSGWGNIGSRAVTGDQVSRGKDK